MFLEKIVDELDRQMLVFKNNRTIKKMSLLAKLKRLQTIMMIQHK